MSQNEVMDQTGDAYLCVIHPVRQGNKYRTEIAPIMAIAATVPDELVAAMIAGPFWRERLVGLCMAVAKRPTPFIEPMLQSLRDPRPIAIVPACAALAVLAKRGIYAMSHSFAEMFDRQAFDGEIGWSTDKAMCFVGLRTINAPGRGPNYGQIFDDHIEVYSWIHAGEQAV